MCVENLRSDFGLEQQFTFAVREGPHDSLLHGRPAVPTSSWMVGRPREGARASCQRPVKLSQVASLKPWVEWTSTSLERGLCQRGARRPGVGVQPAAAAEPTAHLRTSLPDFDAPHGSRISADREHHRGRQAPTRKWEISLKSK